MPQPKKKAPKKTSKMTMRVRSSKKKASRTREVVKAVAKLASPSPAPTPTSRPTAPVLIEPKPPQPAPTALAPIPPTPVLATKALDEEQQKLFTELGSQVLLLKVVDEEGLKTAGEMLVQLKGWQEKLDDARLSRTRPLKEQAKRIEALFHPFNEKIEMWTKQLKARSLAFHQMQAQQVKEQQKKLLAEATEAQEAGDINKASALATQSAEMAVTTNTTLLAGGHTTLRHPWTFEVEDLGKVPEEYKSLDEKKVNAAIRAGLRDMDAEGNPVEAKDGQRERFAIPGIRIFRGTQLAVSANG